MNKFNWKAINYQKEKDDWKKIVKNNLTITLNIFVRYNKKIYPAYVSKQNSKRERQVIRLMIPKKEK